MREGSLVKPEHSNEEIKASVFAALKEKYPSANSEDFSDFWPNIWVDSLAERFGSLENIRGKRALDLACGSLDSLDDGPGFEPWLPRILTELGASVVGIDIGSLEGEPYEHYNIDLSAKGALNFLPDHYFDIIHVKSFNRGAPSPILVKQLIWRDHKTPITEQLQKIEDEIQVQQRRLLKEDGYFMEFEGI